MQLSLQTLTGLVQQFAASAQSAASAALDFTVGSIFRALAEANGAIALWLQWNTVQVLATTRLATSSGVDVDSFVGDFSLTRLAAVAATGSVTFARFTMTGTALVAVGAQVKTADGTQVFSVVADTTQPGFVSALNAYQMLSGVGTVTATVQATNAGTQGNVLAGTITLLATAIPGVDTVSNAAGFTNGVDPESDAALKTRFALYIAGLSKGTIAAIGSAVAGVQQGLNYAVVPNSPTNGSFVVVVDDGTGNPPAQTLNNVFAAVNLVRPVGTSFTVVAPSVTNVSIAATLTVAIGVAKANLIGPVDQAITAFVNTLPIGAVLPYTRLAQIIYDAAPGQILNVTGLSVLGGTADINPGATGVVKAASVVSS